MKALLLIFALCLAGCTQGGADEIKIGMTTSQVAKTMGHYKQVSNNIIQLRFIVGGNGYTYTFENDTLKSISSP